MAKTKTENPLFVEEEDEDIKTYTSSTDSPSQFHEAVEEQPDQKKDPVIRSIPLVLGDVSNTGSQSLHVFQYPTINKTRSLKHRELQAAMKKESDFVEVKIPMDTSKFYDENRGEEWGVRVSEQTTQGVLNKPEGGLYVGKFVGTSEESKLVLLPVRSTVQLKPSFKYLDELEGDKNAQKRTESNDGQRITNVHILQTSAKPNLQANVDSLGHHSLGDSIKSIKKLEEEEWTSLNWASFQEESTKTLREDLFGNADATKLKNETTRDEYIDRLTES